MEIEVDRFCWILAVDLGSKFSSQIRSISMVADFWLLYKVMRGLMRCMIGGKYPNKFENFSGLVGRVGFRFWVK